jgi:cytochrome c-type biogenesis protein CcmH
MLLWIAFALLTVAVLAPVLAPLARPARPEEAEEAGAADAGGAAVYRDQLAEIEAERARGLIGAAEAEAARLEVSRRLLRSAGERADIGPAAAAAPPRPTHSRIAAGTAIAVPLLALVLYLAHGSPDLPASPFATRDEASREQAKVARLIAEFEAHLAKSPEDGKGWDMISIVYMKLGRFNDAAAAYANALRLQGESVERLAGLAEASILASDGIVTEPARTSYEKILKLDPAHVQARFWLAFAKEQDGRLADALAAYRALLKEAPPDAPYRAPIAQRVEEVERRMAALAPETAGPTAADIEAAAKLTPEERARMIAGMVDGLARRLRDNGKDLPGWRRLVNAYAVLGRKEDARAALAEARRNFDGDAGALSELSQLAARLGLGS